MEVETESAVKEDHLCRQKRKKLVIILVIFTVFQIIIILVVMKIRTPQFSLRVKSGTFGFMMTSDAGGTNPSFNVTMYPNIRIKNTNFGPYRYEETKVQFFYSGSPVGRAVVHKSKVGMRSTKKVISGYGAAAAVEVSSTGMQKKQGRNLVNELANDLSLGKLALTSEARLNGKVEILWFIIKKKKKSIHMNCSMELDVFTREFHQINCN